MHDRLTTLNLGYHHTASLNHANHLQQIMLVFSLALRRFRRRRGLAIDLYRRGLLALTIRRFAVGPGILRFGD